MKANIKSGIVVSLFAGLLMLNACKKKENLAVPDYIPTDNGDGTILYTETGTNPPYTSLKLTDKTTAVDGSTINVNNSLVEVGVGSNDISTNINIHTLTDSYISYANAPKFKRWWQLDGKTQVFRLFKDEVSLIDPRGEHPRIEAFSGISWTYDPAVWHTWYGHYTIINTDANGVVIFQDKNSDNDWAFQLTLSPNGDIVLDDRNLAAADNKIVKTAMIGKSFDVKVKDNGKDWECYVNDIFIAKGAYNRPTGTNKFRWGLYASHTQIRNSMIFVSGVHFD